ncbi:transcriptional repressor [Candidatus Woesearchaeota archaeon]|nr:transcriptional repressor [Candidatus Woesearchaeota archaeon]
MSPNKRNTIQKTTILNYLREVDTHPNADTIYNDIKVKIPSISRATVYRILNNLVEENEIETLTIGNEQRFDGKQHGHIHIITKDNIIDLEDKAILRDIENLAKKHNHKPRNIKVIVEV